MLNRQLSDLLAKLTGVRKSGNGWVALCPAHADENASLAVDTGRTGGVLLCCHAGCDTKVVLAAIGMAMSDLAPPGLSAHKLASMSSPRESAVYPYADERGITLYEVVRYEPKDFRQRRCEGHGKYSHSLGGVRRVLYRLPQLRASISKGQIVYIVEGEKDVHALERVGLTATTNAGGAGK